ncbi:hypothetical protein [Kordiimonas sp.]|uniref:hypothetical protein n=1 Tax=Kordiimonas sp. TaxID=1970157 RepID=UPI003A916B1E
MEKIKQYFLPTFMLVSSIILLIVGVPRFLHELMLVPGTPIHERVSRGENVSDDDLDVLEDSRLQALRFVELPAAYSDLGASYLVRAQRATTDADRKMFAEKSIEASTTSVEMAPLNTFAWARITAANIILGEENYPEAATAWRLSIATARFEPFLLIQRVHMGILLYDQLTEEDIDLLKDQLGMAYRWNKKQTRRYAQQQQLTEWFVFLSEGGSEAAEYFAQ